MTPLLNSTIIRVLDARGRTSGTGFVVTDDGLIVTCAHVVTAAGAGPGDTVRVAFHAVDEIANASVEVIHETEDIAILCLNNPLPKDVSPLQLGSSHDTRGRVFETFGFPATKPVEGMAGKCEVIGETTQQGFRVLQLRAGEVTRGYSGAPVWDAKLQIVIGMVTSIASQDKLGKQGKTAFIIPVETLRDVCPALQFPAECPYRGLKIFEREHADLYFGRENAIQKLLAMLSQRDFVALVGVSGSGKSSLVRAGLEKGLRQQTIPGLAERHRCLTVPGRSPIFNLVLALADLSSTNPEVVAQAFDLPAKALTEDGEARRRAAETLDGRSAALLAEQLRVVTPSEGILLITDQFERLYTECSDQDVKDRFIETLLQAAGDKVKILLALRADFYGLALHHPALEEVVKQGGQVTLGRMKKTELRTIIEEPARKAGRGLQPGLAERLIADVRGQAGDLPLLEFALTELWEEDNQKGVLTLETYDSLGYESPDGQRFSGVQGAIALRAEGAWQELSKDERHAARRVFLNLVTPAPLDKQGERVAEDTSRRAWQEEWDETTRRVVRKLGDARLVTTGKDPVSSQPTVEVAHEALIRSWPSLQQWMAEYRPFMQWYNSELAPFLCRWMDKEQHPDFLLPEAMLIQAEHLLQQYPEELSGPPETYIRLSLEKHEEDQKNRERRRRRLTWVAMGAAIVFLILAILACVLSGLTGFQWQRAEREAEERATAQAIAEDQRQLALARQLTAQAQVAFDNTGTGLVRSMLLGVEAMRRLPSLEADQVLRRGLEFLPRSLIHVPCENDVVAVRFSPSGQYLGIASGNIAVIYDTTTGQEITRMVHERMVLALDFNHDGQQLATASGDTVVWDVVTGQEIARISQEETALNVNFSPDGQKLAIASENTVVIWDPVLEQELARIVHEDHVWAMSFSPDSRRIATGSSDHTARIWDIDSDQQITQISHENAVMALAFSPDGQRLATGSEDGTARVWDSTTGEEVARVTHIGAVYTVAFSPNGQLVASAHQTKVNAHAVVWESATGEEVARMAHKATISTLAFSPDGLWLATGSWDDTGRVWDPTSGQEIARMVHEDDVASIAFSPDSQWIATGSRDNTAHIWDLMTGRQVICMEHGRGVWDVAFSPDGRWLATAGSWDGTARVWNPLTGNEITRLAHEGGVFAVVFSPDGELLATASLNSNTVYVWDTASGIEIAQMTHEDGIETIAFSPDGQLIATGSQNGKIRLWNLNTGQELVEMEHEDAVNVVVFSPDGQRLASGGWDDTVRIWDPNTGQEIFELEHSGMIESLAFSPDGQRLASGSSDGVVHIWDPFTGEEIAQMEHEDRVWTMVFSPNGQWLATGGLDQTARVWNVTTGQQIYQMIHEEAVMSVDFDPEGHWLATASNDHTMRVWYLETGQEMVRMMHEGAVSTVEFSPDGQWIATGSLDQTARVWRWRSGDLITEVCAQLPRNLTLEEWEYYIGEEPYQATCPNLPVPER